MPNQEVLAFEGDLSDVSKPFRTVHYLGSKLRILDFIKQLVDELDPEKRGVCDLFSGSGSVSQYLSSERKIVSVDIQEYSNVVCSALLNPVSDKFIEGFTESTSFSLSIENSLDGFRPLIEYEDDILSGKYDLNEVCNYIENASIYSALEVMPKEATIRFKKVLKESIAVLNDFPENSFLAFRYFGGLYFSYKQALQIDAVIKCIDQADPKYRNILLASLVSTASDIVNTVGKQFAQPIRPRNKDGKPKKGILKQIKKDRMLDVIPIYRSWLTKYSERKASNLEHKILKLDYKDALDQLDDSIGIVYADPPYTRDHYSRFYHGLETLCLRDFPRVSKTNIGGDIRLSRGMYREERHQSDFCIKSKAPGAFKALFRKVSDSNRILLLSYSPYDKSKGAHPRVVELEYLEDLATQYFENVEVRSPGTFSHSKLNKTDLHLESSNASEVILVCRN
jgi:adenine-specific DNA methylase